MAPEPPPAPIPGEASPVAAESPPEPTPSEISPPDAEPPEGPIPAQAPPDQLEPQFPPIPAETPATASSGEPPLPPVGVEPSRAQAPPEAPLAPVEPPSRRRRRSWPGRIAAVLALVAAVAVVWLLVHSLRGSGHPHAAAPPPVVKVLVPEGKTRLQIAQIAAADGLTGSYRAASKRSPLLNPVHYGAPRGTPDLEGFLFPATYDMNHGAPAEELVREQLLAFHERFGASEIRRARELHVTPYQLLTVASMVEREAQTSHDRPLIAAVIYNRLHAGMPLGIDATTYYAVELEKGIATYTHELTEAQLHIDSPYNTRTHVGLPPTPISNPGLASIEAAARPARVRFLYYVAAADGCGEQVFSTTVAQFERNVAAYRAAVSKNGGRPPACAGK
jgi:cell division protein YceG involved in septum cleavage